MNADANYAVLVLNDQGGGVMHVSYDKTSTLRSQAKHHEPVVLVYESHGQDCRYTPLGDTCSTISQKYGTGGGNVPILIMREEESEVCGKVSTEILPERSTPTTIAAAPTEGGENERFCTG